VHPKLSFHVGPREWAKNERDREYFLFATQHHGCEQPHIYLGRQEIADHKLVATPGVGPYGMHWIERSKPAAKFNFVHDHS